MKIRSLAFALFIGGMVIAPVQAKQDERQHVKDIEILSKKKIIDWRRIYAERDAAGLDRFLADSFVVLDPDGKTRTKWDEIDWLRKTPRDEKPSDFIYTISQIVFAGQDTAIVYGHGDSTRETGDGKPCHHKYWSSNTFVKIEGQWKAAFSHISGAQCTPVDG